MLLNSRVLPTPGIRKLFAETVSAFAELEAHMRLSATLWAFLLPGLTNGLLDLWFRGSSDSEADDPGFVCLLDRALGMNSTQRVSRGFADGAEMLRRWRGDDHGLFAAHGVSSE